MNIRTHLLYAIIVRNDLPQQSYQIALFRIILNVKIIVK